MANSRHFHKDGQPVQWQHGGRKNVLEVYVRLHDNKLIGEHWLWAAVTRVALHKEPINEVLADYGYAPEKSLGKRGDKIVTQQERLGACVLVGLLCGVGSALLNLPWWLVLCSSVPLYLLLNSAMNRASRSSTLLTPPRELWTPQNGEPYSWKRRHEKR